MTVVPLDESRIDAAVAGHLTAFRGFFLARLGRATLEAFYRAALQERTTIAVAALSNSGELIGCAVGTTDSAGWYQRLIRTRLLSFTRAGLIFLRADPRLALQALRHLHRLQGEPFLEGAYLASIYSLVEGRGVGGRLLREWEESVQARGSTKAWLTTDAENNSAVVDFYVKNGWLIERLIDRYGNRRMLVLAKVLSPKLGNNGV